MTNMELTARYPHCALRNVLLMCLLAACFGAVVTPGSDTQNGQETPTTEKLQVRLSGGFTLSEGRVMIFTGGLWRTVCDTGWGIPEADVICKQRGYGYATMAWRGAHFGEPTETESDFRIALSCTGREDDLSGCSHRQISAHTCGKFKTAGVRCSSISSLNDNQIRLVGGITPNIGRVEIYHNRSWTVICDESWDLTQAEVVCRELGYPGAIAHWGKTLIHFDRTGYSQKAVDSLSCSGLEETITNCMVGTARSVLCQEPATVSCVADEPIEPLPYKIRLTGGDQPNKGRVEIAFGESWGTICDKNWDLKDARVVCRQLGYPYATAAPGGAHFGEGTGVVLLGQVDCSGHERHLLECSRSGIGATGCQHGRDAGVVCSMDPTVKPAGTLVRLSGGSSGFVEVFYDGQWWRVCGGDWDLNDASVVCRQLGYHSSSNKNISLMSLTSRGGEEEEDLGVLLDKMRCRGNETSVAFCQHEGLGPKLCATAMAAVDCNGNMPPRTNGLENSIRLSGGTYPMEGRVEIYLEGAWATVCGDRWDMADAEVVCRQLGFTHATSALVRAHFGPGFGPIVLDEVACVGDEEELVDCLAEVMYQHDCQHRQDAAVRCDSRIVSQDYSVRLSGGATPNAGRVELLLNGNWHTVCDATGTWDIREAQVVCRELGFPRALAPWAKITGVLERAWERRSFGSVECLGNETRTAKCRHGVVGSLDCEGLEHEARVLCEPRPFGKLTYSVRLEGGRTPREGKVQIRHDDQWLPVCGDDWDIADARVVCRQLGYQFAKSATTVREKTSAALAQGMTNNNRAQFKRSFPHVRGWSGFRCTGHEDHLLQCSHVEEQGVGCGRGVVAQVLCSDKPSMPAGERLRLSGNAEENEGRVEVYFDGIWWKVCGDDWDIRDAKVVCHQLGYPSALAAYTLTDKFSNDVVCENNAEILGDLRNVDCDLEYLMSDLQCTGNESGVAECRHAGFGRQYCGLDHDAAVVCDGKRTKLTFEARLCASDPSQPYEGRVELSHDDHWWLVCNTGWDHQDATVLCHQLGFPGVESPDLQPSFNGRECGGMGFLLDDVQCDGTEGNIAECLHGGLGRGRCEGQTAAGVKCATDSLMIEGEDIRLIGGDSVLDGRVELYHDQRWWTICDDNWDIKAAEVACKQLGLPSAESAVFGAYFGSGRAAMGILLDEVNCKGSEENLLECSHHVLGEHDCNHSQDAGVRCAPPTVQHQLKLPKPLRLSGGSNASEGRVEIYHSFRWWRVCKSGNQSDDMNAALIACRQLDFSAARDVVPTENFEMAPTYARVLLSGLRCQGTERNLSLCRHDDGLGKGQGCDRSQDLAVRCTDSDPTNADRPLIAPTRRKRSGPTTPVLAVIIATVFVTGFLIGSLILYHVYKACDRFLSRHPAVISGDAVRSPSTTANLDRPELAREARESARNKDMFIELYPLPPPPPDGEDTETEGGDEHEYSDWGGTPIRRETNSGPPPNTPDIAFDGTLV